MWLAISITAFERLKQMRTRRLSAGLPARVHKTILAIGKPASPQLRRATTHPYPNARECAVGCLVDLTPLTDEEQETLRTLVEKHFAETDSAVAGRLLKDWPAAVAEFTAVVPRDYKRVMELIRTAEAAGRNVDEAVMGVQRA